MSKAAKHYGHFLNGKLQCESFARHMADLAKLGGTVVLTAEPFRGKRSNDANGYYWKVVIGVIREGMKDAGFDPSECRPDAVHAMLKYRFLKVDKPIGSDGEFVTLVRSTTELNTEEFGQYLEHCVQFAAEYLNTIIPPPGEQVEMIA